MAKNDQRGLEGEGGATTKQYAIREVAKAQRAVKEKKKLFFDHLFNCDSAHTLIISGTDLQLNTD